jgi:hypothetical protein
VGISRGCYIGGYAGWILDRAVSIGQGATQCAPRGVELSPDDCRTHDSDGFFGCAIHGGGWASRIFSDREQAGVSYRSACPGVVDGTVRVGPT